MQRVLANAESVGECRGRSRIEHKRGTCQGMHDEETAARDCAYRSLVISHGESLDAALHATMSPWLRSRCVCAARPLACISTFGMTRCQTTAMVSHTAWERMHTLLARALRSPEVAGGDAEGDSVSLWKTTSPASPMDRSAS